MSAGFWRLFAALSVALCATLALAWCVSACSAAPSAAQQSALAEDSLAQKDCVDNAGAGLGKVALKTAIDACRDQVKARRDGGK